MFPGGSRRLLVDSWVPRLIPCLASCLVVAACAHQRPVSAGPWPPPCAGSTVMEVNNPIPQTLEVTWGGESLGTVGTGISRLPVPNIRLLDPSIVGGPVFRVQTDTPGIQGAVVTRARYRLLCE